MSERSKAFASVAAAFILSFGLSLALTPWADLVAIIVVVGIAATSSTFAVVYATTRPWWTTTIGRAMLISSSGLALLTDIALLYNFLGDDYALRDAVRLTVYIVILIGSCYKLRALLRERRGRD